MKSGLDLKLVHPYEKILSITSFLTIIENSGNFLYHQHLGATSSHHLIRRHGFAANLSHSSRFPSHTDQGNPIESSSGISCPIQILTSSNHRHDNGTSFAEGTSYHQVFMVVPVILILEFQLIILRLYFLIFQCQHQKPIFHHGSQRIKSGFTIDCH